MLSDPSTNVAVSELTEETQSLVALAATPVTTPAEYADAADDVKRIKGALKRVTAIRGLMAAAARQAIIKLFGASEDDVQRAEKDLKNAETARKRAMIAFDQEQKRQQREAQLAAEAAAGKERERLLARSAKAEASGNMAKAAVLEHQALTVVAPVLMRETPRISGQSIREIWKYRIRDASLLPREYTMPDDKKIGGVVRAMRGDTSIPGVEVYSESSLASSAA